MMWALTARFVAIYKHTCVHMHVFWLYARMPRIYSSNKCFNSMFSSEHCNSTFTKCFRFCPDSWKPMLENARNCCFSFGDVRGVEREREKAMIEEWRGPRYEAEESPIDPERFTYTEKKRINEGKSLRDHKKIHARTRSLWCALWKVKRARFSESWQS